MALIDGLISYWSLDEASGTRADSHGVNDLTDNNTVGSAVGKQSNAADFELANAEYLSRADNADLSTGDIDFYFEAWIKVESTGTNMAVLSKDAGGSTREYGMYLAGGTVLRFYVFSAAGAFTEISASTFGSLSTGVWYFVEGWHDATNNQLGVAVNGTTNTSAYANGVKDASASFEIGRNSNTNHFDGLIDGVGFWKRVLTSDERTELYNSGNGRDYAYISGGGGGSNRRRRFLIGAAA